LLLRGTGLKLGRREGGLSKEGRGVFRGGGESSYFLEDKSPKKKRTTTEKEYSLLHKRRRPLPHPLGELLVRGTAPWGKGTFIISGGEPDGVAEEKPISKLRLWDRVDFLREPNCVTGTGRTSATGFQE